MSGAALLGVDKRQFVYFSASRLRFRLFGRIPVLASGVYFAWRDGDIKHCGVFSRSPLTITLFLQCDKRHYYQLLLAVAAENLK